MTLAPVFRSPRALELLRDGGIFDLLGSALDRQRVATARVRGDLAAIVGPEAVRDGGSVPETRLEALQQFFFLSLFLAVFEELGVPPERLDLYAELDFCVMGTITAADNLFDDEAKSLLPLELGPGPRFGSIVQLMCFERLTQRVGARAQAAGLLEPAGFTSVQRDLLRSMIAIGELEGSEEGGVDEVPDPAVMIERVHRVRGGRLFALAAVAPRTVESGPVRDAIANAEPALVALGTAFQIVDDLVDFEDDLQRRSHNLLRSWIVHRGTPEERAVLADLLAGGPVPPGIVEVALGRSAGQVLDRAREEAREAFAGLRRLGFDFPPGLADGVAEAIVGLDGVGRMDALVGPAEGAA